MEGRFMRKVLNGLFIFLLTLGIAIPVLVFADDAEKEPVTVYMFRGEGCPHCEEALEWFNSEDTQEEYGKYFKLETYEVWNNGGNAMLMDSVAEKLNVEAGGVPFIVIGKETYDGFLASDTQTLIDYIMKEYEKDEEDRIDTVATVIKETNWEPTESEPAGDGTGSGSDYAAETVDTTNSKTTDIIIGVSFLVVVAGVVFAVIKARKSA